MDKMMNNSDLQNFLSAANAKSKVLLEYAFAHPELVKEINVEVELLEQDCKKVTSFTNTNNPYMQECMLLESIEKTDNKELLENLNSYTQQLKATQTGCQNETNFGFYHKNFENLTKTKKLSAKNLEILGRNLKSDLSKSFTKRYNDWCLGQICKMRQKYLKELLERIAQFKQLEDLLSPFMGQTGFLWDMSKGLFQNFGFEVLKEFADLLENDQTLQELADLLGRAKAESDKYEKELRDKIEVKTVYHPTSAYKGQINGMCLSGDISAAIPSELALYKNPATKKYFMKKFVEKQLLSFSYVNQMSSTYKEHTKEEVKVAIKDKKGPVIICVDTSGSMQGAPERIAKTITFALAKKCLAEDRKCYLISFSTGIEVQDLSKLEGGDALNQLIMFLRKSFNGGTDASPALQHSLSLLKQNDWKNADVLMVSDFVMGNLESKIEEDIMNQQKAKSKFYSLVIGNTGNEMTIKVFDENWAYNPNSKDSMKNLVRRIRKITSKSA